MTFINGLEKNFIDNEDNEKYPLVELFNLEKLRHLRNSTQGARDSEQAHTVVRNIDSFIRRGTKRRLMTMTQTYRTELQDMQNEFPNFKEVIDYITCCAELAWHTDRVLRFTPILLTGPGGIGKTRFAERLAKWCTSSFHRIAIAASQNGSDLAGSSSFWSNATPGIIFNCLIRGDFANPLVFLDEVDKSAKDGRYDPLGALYVLLEPSSARHFEDLCYPFPLDASHVMYIAACNDSTQIPEPLRTRFREFSVSITREQSKRIAANIAFRTLERLTPAIDGIAFTEDAIESLSAMTPRKIEQAVMEAIGRALAGGHKKIEFIPSCDKSPARIGFLP